MYEKLTSNIRIQQARLKTKGWKKVHLIGVNHKGRNGSISIRKSYQRQSGYCEIISVGPAEDPRILNVCGAWSERQNCGV